MSKFFTWIKSVFGGKLWSFLTDVFTAVKSQIVNDLKDIALQAVKTAQETGLDSAAKRAAAFKQIADYAKAKGITASDSLINLVIELAVQKIKG